MRIPATEVPRLRSATTRRSKPAMAPRSRSATSHYYTSDPATTAPRRSSTRRPRSAPLPPSGTELLRFASSVLAALRAIAGTGACRERSAVMVRQRFVEKTNVKQRGVDESLLVSALSLDPGRQDWTMTVNPNRSNSRRVMTALPLDKATASTRRLAEVGHYDRDDISPR